jgi:hypothetical protein
MASHCYAMPLVSVVTPFGPRLRPKYQAEVGFSPWGFLEYPDPAVGVKGCIVAAVVTVQQDTALKAKPDVVATPIPQQASTPMKNAAALALTIARQTADFADAT